MVWSHGSLTLWLDWFGLSVFAASGTLAAVRRRLDFIGACFFALITATGGGTLRDLLIGAPVFWMHDKAPVIVCVLVATAAWIVPLRWWPERTLDWLDAAGLAAYAVFGAEKALEAKIDAVPAVAVGVIAACVGGVIRDITAGVPSILLRHEFYVTPVLAASASFVALARFGVPGPWPTHLAMALGFGLRAGAIGRGWMLPPHAGR